MQSRERVKKLLEQLGDSETGFHASLLLSNLGLGEYAEFTSVLSETQKQQQGIAYELLRSLHAKVLVELEKIERLVVKLGQSETTAHIRALNDQIKQKRSYSEFYPRLKTIIGSHLPAAIPQREEILLAAAELSKNIAASVQLAQILLASISPTARQRTREQLSRMGEFGQEALEVEQNSARSEVG